MSMEDLTTLFLLCVNVWTCLTIVFAQFKYPVFDWRHCDNDNEAFLIFRAIPIQRCLFECHVRSRCHALEYFVTRRECKLLETETRMARMAMTKRACIFIRMSDLEDKTKVPDTCQNCTDLQVCDVKTGSCDVKECKRLSVKNADVFGNMQSIGSKVKISPHPGYGLVRHSGVAQCNVSGEWDDVPKIVRACEDGWFQIEQSCYHTDPTVKRIFDKADNLCKQSNANLLQIETEAENSQLEPYVQDTVSDSNNRGWWIGIRKDNEQWRFTESNATVSFFHWHYTEPNDRDGEEQCAVIGFKKRSVNWTDVSCHKAKKVMCEKRLQE